MGKRGQVTMFIIAGIVIVLVAVAIIMVTRTDVQIGERVGTVQVEPIKEYVEECIEEELELSMPLLKYYAGSFSNNYGVPGDDLNLISHIKSNIEVERMLSNKVKGKLQSGCSLNGFKDNFDLTYDLNNIFVEVDIRDLIVDVIVEFPIIIEKDDFKVGLESFSGSIESDYGILARTARDFLREGEGGCPTSYTLPMEFAVKGVKTNIFCPNNIQFWIEDGGAFRFRLFESSNGFDSGRSTGVSGGGGIADPSDPNFSPEIFDGEEA